jgi:hypothetical protein
MPTASTIYLNGKEVQLTAYNRCRKINNRKPVGTIYTFDRFFHLETQHESVVRCLPSCQAFAQAVSVRLRWRRYFQLSSQNVWQAHPTNVPDEVHVPWGRILPPASFRFLLAVNTLALG